MEGLRRRHHYGTTGSRVILDTRVRFDNPAELFRDDPGGQDPSPERVDAAMMGDILRSGDECVTFAIDVHRPSPIERIDIRNGLDTLEVYRPYEEADLGRRIRILWEGSEYRGRGRETIWDGHAEENLRFFEAAARHQSFVRAGSELGVTAAAVAHRIHTLEKHLDTRLFERHRRGVHLNPQGGAYLKEVQRILADVHGVSERHRRRPRRVRIVSVEAVAQKWLGPRLAAFKAAHPGIALELETNHRGVDPARHDFDAWLAYTGETAAPRPVTRREDTLLEEPLYEETLFPVCSPVLLAAYGRPRAPADLHDWPLLYDLGWDADWAYWFARLGQPTPDLAQASGFRLYSMLVEAAVNGLGVRAPDPGVRALLPHHHRRLAAAARAAGVPGVDPGGGEGRRPERPGWLPAPSVTARRGQAP